MTDLATIQANLAELERLAIETANAISRLVPDGCDRNALILEAYNRVGGMAAEAGRAKRVFDWAIKEA